MRPSVDAHTGSYDLAKHMLTVQATSTSASASLNALVASSGQLIGTLTNAGGGKYQGQFSLATTPRT
jgi:hypothetical protein